MMKCPVCVKTGQRSEVRENGPGSCTLMYCAQYSDEDGVYHPHDCNTTTGLLRCSNGHEWVVGTSGSCHCGWGQTEPDITITVGEPAKDDQ